MSFPGEERGFRGIRGNDLGGSATAPLSSVDDDGSSVDVAEVGMLGVATKDEMSCEDSGEESTEEEGCGVCGTSRDVHSSFSDKKNSDSSNACFSRSAIFSFSLMIFQSAAVVTLISI